MESGELFGVFDGSSVAGSDDGLDDGWKRWSAVRLGRRWGSWIGDDVDPAIEEGASQLNESRMVPISWYTKPIIPTILIIDKSASSFQK